LKPEKNEPENQKSQSATTTGSKTIPRTALDQKLDEFEKDFGNYEAFKKARETLNKE
jgi:hypothetical protein